MAGCGTGSSFVGASPRHASRNCAPARALPHSSRNTPCCSHLVSVQSQSSHPNLEQMQRASARQPRSYWLQQIDDAKPARLEVIDSVMVATANIRVEHAVFLPVAHATMTTQTGGSY
ncbi:hypothetical protein PMIN03_012891 [Paraphaeosphaeria minitans]